VKTETSRKQKQFWAITDDLSVVRVTGWCCGQNNPNYWWVPELGYSMSDKHHLFVTETIALKKAVKQLSEKVEKDNARLKALKKRLPNFLGQ